jgi:hypothetical protein
MVTRIPKKIQYILGYSNSTTTETVKNPQLGSAYITVKGITNEDIALRDAPETLHRGMKGRAQAAVTKSLERSLVENADIWSELAKH